MAHLPFASRFLAPKGWRVGAPIHRHRQHENDNKTLTYQIHNGHSVKENVRHGGTSDIVKAGFPLSVAKTEGLLHVAMHLMLHRSALTDLRKAPVNLVS
ncbi:hypothetical protein E4U43_005260, partial [Claviceps pusilla]